QLEQKTPLTQQFNSAETSIIRARNRRQRLVGFPRASIQRDLDVKRRPLHQIVGNLLRDQRAVSEECDQKALLLGVGVNVEKILAGKNFASGVEQPEAAHVDQLVEHAEVLFRGHFTAAGILVTHGEIVVTVLALERTAPRHFNRYLHRRTLTGLAMVEVRAERPVS